MKQFFLIAFSLLVTTNCLLAQQSKIDSLENLLKDVKEDTNRVTILNILSFELRRTNSDTAKFFARQAIDLAQRLNFQKGIADGFGNLGNVSSNQGDYDKAVNFYTEALKISQVLGDKLKTSVLMNNMGIVFKEQGEYEKSLNYFLLALKIREEMGDKYSIALYTNNIGNLYRVQGNWEKALNNYKQAYQAFLEIDNKSGIAMCSNNMGLLLTEHGNYEEALNYLLKSMELRKEIGDKRGLAMCLGNIGILYFDQKQYNKAMNYYLEALKITEELGDQWGISNCMQEIGLVYANVAKEKNDFSIYPKAINYLNKGLNIALNIGNKEITMGIYQTLSNTYEMMNDFKNAYKNHQLYSQIKDSLFNEESSKQIAEMQTKYDTEKKEQQIILLEKEGELQKSEVRRQKFIIWSVAGGLLIVIVFSYFIFKERRKSEKLLLNILPVETARELKKKGKTQPKHYKLVTVLFTDFKGFTKIAEKMSVEELVAALDFIFRKFDEIISQYPIEKIKTIGDAYMCAGGLPLANTTNPMDVVNAALDIKKFMHEYKEKRIAEGKPFFEIRIGVHTGPVVAGVVGDKKFAYDIWGDTVNTASRMESSGEPGKVNISGETYKKLTDFENHKGLKFTFRGKIPAKNKGEIEMYFVERNEISSLIPGIRVL